MAAAGTSKALTAWKELNDRQQGTLAVIFDLDQAAEQGRRKSAARGEWDDRPASEWRAIDFSHEPSNRELFGWTVMQTRLAAKGWDNQGNGSTIAALADRGLLERDARATAFGVMRQVRMTRSGRAAARIGIADTPGGPRKAALGMRSWEVLARLWAADARGEVLRWGYSLTIEKVLVDKHVPPLAEFAAADGGYRITERGRDFYREQYAAHAAAHPDVHALHPDGAEAEPWPAEADARLARLARVRRALARAWEEAREQHRAAEAETGGEPAPSTGFAAAERERCLRDLPAEAAQLRAARVALWESTARQRAEQAAADLARLEQLLTEAARAWAAAALHGYNAVIAGVDPLTVLPAGGDPDGWTELRLVPPAETGVHGLDDDAGRLYAVAVGAPRKRRGPAPKKRRRFTSPQEDPVPGTPCMDLARWLTDQLAGGSLVRRLHPYRLTTDTSHAQTAGESGERH